jgi:hypothetical protein
MQETELLHKRFNPDSNCVVLPLPCSLQKGCVSSRRLISLVKHD